MIEQEIQDVIEQVIKDLIKSSSAPVSPHWLVDNPFLPYEDDPDWETYLPLRKERYLKVMGEELSTEKERDWKEKQSDETKRTVFYWMDPALSIFEGECALDFVRKQIRELRSKLNG